MTSVLQAVHILSAPPTDPVTLLLASERGRIIHDATERIDQGADPGIPEPALAGYLKAYGAFCSVRLFLNRPDWSETPICDPSLQYAGTPDRVGFLGENLDGAVLDLKTGKPEPGIGVQLAAYRALLRANGVQITHRLSVHLRANGTFKVVEYLDPGDESAFLAALTIHRWRTRHR